MSLEPREILPKLDRLLTYLAKDFDEYPFHDGKDPKYFNRLIEEFADLDIEEELKQYHAWILDQPDHKKIYYRSRFRTWLKTCRQFRQHPVSSVPNWLRRRYVQGRY